MQRTMIETIEHQCIFECFVALTVVDQSTGRIYSTFGCPRNVFVFSEILLWHSLSSQTRESYTKYGSARRARG